jgi:hypothetical protein
MHVLARLSALVFLTPLTGSCAVVRLVTFGDSNTDAGWATGNPNAVAVSYVSAVRTRPEASAPHSPTQLAGTIEALAARYGVPISVVNHGIAGTGTGPARSDVGAPGARTTVNGVTRFDAEVLGLGAPWNGGEPVNADYPKGGIVRSRAFRPTAADFVYVSLGTNDAFYGLKAAASADNIVWMVQRWTSAGLPANHFIVTTLAPRTDGHGAEIPALNDSIRSLARRLSVKLIDLAAYTSADNGRTWRSASYQIGDGVHYSEMVRDWLASQVSAAIASGAIAPAAR